MAVGGPLCKGRLGRDWKPISKEPRFLTHHREIIARSVLYSPSSAAVVVRVFIGLRTQLQQPLPSPAHPTRDIQPEKHDIRNAVAGNSSVPIAHPALHTFFLFIKHTSGTIRRYRTGPNRQTYTTFYRIRRIYKPPSFFGPTVPYLWFLPHLAVSAIYLTILVSFSCLSSSTGVGQDLSGLYVLEPCRSTHPARPNTELSIPLLAGSRWRLAAFAFTLLTYRTALIVFIVSLPSTRHRLSQNAT